MRILSDTHVHIYRCFNPELLIRSAINRFSQLAPPESGFLGILFFTERRGNSFFSRLREDPAPLAGFSEAVSLFSERIISLKIAAHAPLLLVSGLQWVSASGIEILALHSEASPRTGLSEKEILSRIHQEGGIPVLPWSPGKWIGARGKIIQALIEDSSAPRFLLGDIPLRPSGLGPPALFKSAEKRGIPVLRGSDALPFAGQETRVGSYGSMLSPTSIDAPSICEALWHPTQPFGDRMNILRAGPLITRALFSKPREVDF